MYFVEQQAKCKYTGKSPCNVASQPHVTLPLAPTPALCARMALSPPFHRRQEGPARDR